MGSENIILIDDSPEIRGNLSDYLRAEGYDVDTSSDGPKAFRG